MRLSLHFPTEGNREWEYVIPIPSPEEGLYQLNIVSTLENSDGDTRFSK